MQMVLGRVTGCVCGPRVVSSAGDNAEGKVGVGGRVCMYVPQGSLKEEGKEPLGRCEGTRCSCPECRARMVAPPRWAAGLSKGPEGLVRAQWDTWGAEGGTEDSSGAL